MKVLTTTAEIRRELAWLIEECASCKVAVAWASIGFEAFDLLVKNSSKIARMIVGVHFYQTNPQFIESFLKHSNVRFIMRTNGVFHPKVYLFVKRAGEWECLVGSPNFTKGGCALNDEMAVLISNRDAEAQEALENVTRRLDTYWSESSRISEAELDIYREAWKRKQPLVRNLGGRFGNPEMEDADDGGANPRDVEILKISWAQYVEEVKAERHSHTEVNPIEERLKVIRATRKLVSDRERFSQIDRSGRQKIAGLGQTEEANFL